MTDTLSPAKPSVSAGGEVTLAVSPDRCLAVSSSHQAGMYMPVEVTIGLSQSIWKPIVAPFLYKGSWLSSKYFKYIS